MVEEAGKGETNTTPRVAHLYRKQTSYLFSKNDLMRSFFLSSLQVFHLSRLYFLFIFLHFAQICSA